MKPENKHKKKGTNLYSPTQGIGNVLWAPAQTIYTDRAKLPTPQLLQRDWRSATQSTNGNKPAQGRRAQETRNE